MHASSYISFKKHELGNLARLAAKEEHFKQVKAFADQQRKVAEEKHKQKMEMYEKKKNALDKALLNRLTAKDEHIKIVKATVQVQTEAQSKIAEEKLNQKLLQSVEITEAKRQAQKERLQAHVKRMKEAKNVVQEMTELHSKVTEEKIQKKMEASTENRQSCLQDLKLRLHEKSLDAEQKRQTMEEIHTLQKKIFEEKHQQKMEKYDENSMAIRRAKQEQLDAHNKHVERVCRLAKEKRMQAQRG